VLGQLLRVRRDPLEEQHHLLGHRGLLHLAADAVVAVVLALYGGLQRADQRQALLQLAQQIPCFFPTHRSGTHNDTRIKGCSKETPHRKKGTRGKIQKHSTLIVSYRIDSINPCTHSCILYLRSCILSVCSAVSSSSLDSRSNIGDLLFWKNDLSCCSAHSDSFVVRVGRISFSN
jgi:hypothetical protein